MGRATIVLRIEDVTIDDSLCVLIPGANLLGTASMLGVLQDWLVGLRMIIEC